MIKFKRVKKVKCFRLFVHNFFKEYELDKDSPFMEFLYEAEPLMRRVIDNNITLSKIVEFNYSKRAIRRLIKDLNKKALFDEVQLSFEEDTFYSAYEIKGKLINIYRKHNIERSPTGSDIHKYFVATRELKRIGKNVLRGYYIQF